MDYNSPYRDMLIYHGLGSGKTRSAINIYNMLYNYSPDWNVFILLKATMKDSIWIKELESWLQKEEKEFRVKNIEFISYDAPNADKIFLEKVKNADAAKKSLYIIEESHNFFNNVYSNLSSKQGRRALTIYELLILSSIPANWNIPQWADDTLIRKVIGEGIPPKLIRIAIESLMKLIKNER